MTDERRFNELLEEFRRVGVNPDSFSAMIDVDPQTALSALRALPDLAGPTAFLAQLRAVRSSETSHKEPA
jgi:hypothetical protein